MFKSADTNKRSIKYLGVHFLFLIVVVFSVFSFSRIESVAATLTPAQLQEVNNTWEPATDPNRFPHFLGTNDPSNPYPHNMSGASTEYQGKDYHGYIWHSQSGPYLSGSYSTTQYVLTGFFYTPYYGEFVIVAEGSGTVNMDSWTYGEKASTPTLTNNTNTSVSPSYHYYGINGTEYNDSQIPTNPGTYKVEASVGTDKTNYRLSYKASKEFEIRVPKTEINVQKIWNDNYNEWSTRPQDVIIGLYTEGNSEPVKTVTLNEANNWSSKFTDVDSTKNYTVKEVNVPEHYTTYVEGDVKNGFVVYNVHNEITTVTASLTKKLWMHTGIVTPNAEFVFTFEPFAEEQKKQEEQNGQNENNGQNEQEKQVEQKDLVDISNHPQIPDYVAKFTNSDEGVTTGNIKTVTNEYNDILANVEFTEPGIYRYLVKEKNDTYTPLEREEMIYSDTVYVMTIIVTKGHDKIYVSSVKYGIMNPETKEITDAPDGMVFINTFMKTEIQPPKDEEANKPEDNTPPKDEVNSTPENNEPPKNEEVNKPEDDKVDEPVIQPQPPVNNVPSEPVKKPSAVIENVADKVTEKVEETKTEEPKEETKEEPEEEPQEEPQEEVVEEVVEEVQQEPEKPFMLSDIIKPELRLTPVAMATSSDGTSSNLKTGIILNNLPFITLIAVSVGALAATVIIKIKR